MESRRVTLSGADNYEYSVPSMVTELIESTLDRDALDTLLFGGSPAPDQLPRRAKRTFPATML